MFLTDLDIVDILSKNSLIFLETFSMKENNNKELTIFAVENLLESCQNLKSVTQLR